MKTTTRLFAGTTATVSLLGLGLVGAGAASASEPPRHDTHPVVRHDDRPDRHRHHDLLAICRPEHRDHRHAILVRVHNRHQLRAIERRFDLECRVIRVI